MVHHISSRHVWNQKKNVALIFAFRTLGLAPSNRGGYRGGSNHLPLVLHRDLRRNRRRTDGDRETRVSQRELRVVSVWKRQRAVSQRRFGRAQGRRSRGTRRKRSRAQRRDGTGEDLVRPPEDPLPRRSARKSAPAHSDDGEMVFSRVRHIVSDGKRRRRRRSTLHVRRDAVLLSQARGTRARLRLGGAARRFTRRCSTFPPWKPSGTP